VNYFAGSYQDGYEAMHVMKKMILLCLKRIGSSNNGNLEDNIKNMIMSG